MERARLRHGTGQRVAHGRHAGHGRGSEILHHIFFGGRRRRVFAQLADLSGVRSGDRVLDVGCGTGYFTRQMARSAAPRGSALGVDPDQVAIAQARRATRLSNCEFSEGTAEALEMPEGTFDVVVSSLMIHHLPESLRAQAIAEMFRVLRPGGRVLIAEFRPPSSRIGRLLIRPFVSPAMENNSIHLLEPMVREAGFGQVDSGNACPWIRYVQGVKPAGGQ